MDKKMLLKVERSFDAAHRLYSYNGPCGNFHGHTWRVILTFNVTKRPLDASGISVDFKDIKRLIDKVLPDHKNLNTTVFFSPTAENLSAWLFTKIKDMLASGEDYIENVLLERLELFEGPKSSIIIEEV